MSKIVDLTKSYLSCFRIEIYIYIYIYEIKFETSLSISYEKEKPFNSKTIN
jgi:hypothetical protein